MGCVCVGVVYSARRPFKSRTVVGKAGRGYVENACCVESEGVGGQGMERGGGGQGMERGWGGGEVGCEWGGGG